MWKLLKIDDNEVGHGFAELLGHMLGFDSFLKFA